MSTPAKRRAQHAAVKKASPAGSFSEQQIPLSEKWVLPQEAMKFLQCCDNTLRKYRREKLLPWSKIGGRVFYNLTDIHQMLLNGRRESLKGR